MTKSSTSERAEIKAKILIGNVRTVLADQTLYLSFAHENTENFSWAFVFIYSSFTAGHRKVSNLLSDTRWDIIATRAVERDKAEASMWNHRGFR